MNLQDLNDASQILVRIKIETVNTLATALWVKLLHAQEYIDAQIAEYLAAGEKI